MRSRHGSRVDNHVVVSMQHNDGFCVDVTKNMAPHFRKIVLKLEVSRFNSIQWLFSAFEFHFFHSSIAILFIVMVKKRLDIYADS